MNKENIAAAKVEGATIRITRARAKALDTARSLIQKPPRPELKRVLRANSKRTATDENKPISSATACSQNKRRAVLADVSNFLSQRSQVASSNAAKVQTRKQVKGYPSRKNSSVTSYMPIVLQQGENVKGNINEGLSELKVGSRDISSTMKERLASDMTKLDANHSEVNSPEKLDEKLGICSSRIPEGNECYEADARPVRQNSRPIRLQSLLKKDGKFHEKSVTSVDPKVVDIDSNYRDPQMCSVYALDIYNNIRVTELKYRPFVDYMDKVQQDITQSMRAILIDWLVEVSEEYKLAPDTLYLTVNLIDRFLSYNYIEKQRLQLLGVTCMLIASKYEEICAPRAEEFCSITDNTYTKEEVVKMESQVLNLLRFQLSIPTIKTFLRRFIQAAQATSENPSVDLEFMANYLAELTLVDYSFLKFLPSLIAASAVFLARWALNQLILPWNPTLEHYTSYKTMDLKVTVLAIQDLQLSAKSCAANAIREKYRQQKFNCIANLSSKAVQALFSS